MKNLCSLSVSLIVSVLLLLGCTGKDQVVPATNSSTGKQVTDVLGEKYVDPQTGQVYIHNRNRRPMTGRGGSSPNARTQAPVFTDWSGQVEIAIWESSAYGQIVSASCSVDPGWLCVGGGGWIDYGGGAGALLTETRPLDNNYTGWAASSKDHVFTNFHTLYTYAIGLRLKNVPAETLKQYLITVSQTNKSLTQPSDRPRETIELPRGVYTVIGGGGRANWTGAGQLLFDCIPATNRGTDANAMYYRDRFHVASKDHVLSDRCTMTGYAIGIKYNDYIPGFGYIETYLGSSGALGQPKTATIATTTAPAGWVITCPGAQSNWDWNQPGRLLFGISPDYDGRTAWAGSKDHRYESTGNLFVTGIWIRKKP